MKLIDTVDEQRILEELLDVSKAPVPDDCAHLHYLLFTPFRYEARSDSRFRRAGATSGVFYASERIETAIAEIAFWRLLFFAESLGTPWPANALELTAFTVRYRTELCLDLTAPPYDLREAEWIDPVAYGPCHDIADEARRLGAQAIRSRSARDPEQGVNVSLLCCAVFSDPMPVARRTVWIKLSASGVLVKGEQPGLEKLFDRLAFARDPRIARFDWDR